MPRLEGGVCSVCYIVQKSVSKTWLGHQSLFCSKLFFSPFYFSAHAKGTCFKDLLSVRLESAGPAGKIAKLHPGALRFFLLANYR